jgi:nitrate/TMAO reductase-like tetraheme cytochrome c subunit
METMHGAISVNGWIALVCSALAVAILVVYLVKRPALDLGTQLWLFFGLGVLPIGTALTGNVAGMEATKSVEFCSSCHVMLAHTGDALDPRSQSLAARHSRNALFGGESCYTCHEDYGMFGAVFTKLNGLHHVYEYLRKYRTRSLEDALPELELYTPLSNRTCQQCHSGTNKLWRDVDEHAAASDELASGKVSCASEGCHGYAHPFSKAARAERARRNASQGEAP